MIQVQIEDIDLEVENLEKKNQKKKRKKTIKKKKQQKILLQRQNMEEDLSEIKHLVKYLKKK